MTISTDQRPDGAEAIAAAFSLGAAGYDPLRRQLVPCFDRLYGTALDIIDAWGPPAAARVLDLGAGTGLFAAMLLERLPDARLHLVDVSAAMLAKARQRFTGRNVTFETADYATAPLGGPYDLVISALSIHHLEDEAKRDLFHRLFTALRPGGLFVNAEQILAPTPTLQARDFRLWQDTAARLGAPAAEIEAAKQRMRLDRCATLENQLAWLRGAGFEEVDCAFKQWQFATYSGMRPG